MKNKQVTYQVFVDSIHDSDVAEFDLFGDALDFAKKWQAKEKDKVVILRVTTEELEWTL